MALTMVDLFKINVDGTAISAAKTELTARQHKIVVDEPRERGGTDVAATPLEHMLSAFLSCTNVITQFVATQKKLKIDSMEMSLTGHFDTRGVFEKAEVRKPFPTIELSVTIRSGMSEEDLEGLKTSVAARCPVSVILREAGCDIIEDWKLA